VGHKTILDMVVVLWKENLVSQPIARPLLIDLSYIYSCTHLKDWNAVIFVIIKSLLSRTLFWKS
jgi:hypothetical protein